MLLLKFRRVVLQKKMFLSIPFRKIYGTALTNTILLLITASSIIPYLKRCLDSAAGSTFVSSIDFNNGYHQIPCAEHSKQYLAFSPGYSFGQWTGAIMPKGP